MNKKFILIGLFSMSAFAADNEIYIDQAGVTANIDLEQLGSGNLIGGLLAIAGQMTAADFDGGNLTLDVNQIGNTNKFLADVYADSLTAFFEFDGDSNTYTLTIDPDNTFGADSSDLNVVATGSSNTFTLDLGTTSLASNTDLDWIINGDSNTFDFNINYDGATNYVDVTFNINQLSTQDNDWLKILSTGSNGTICINQNDQGTSTSC